MKDFFLVIGYVSLFTITIGGVFWFIYYQVSNVGFTLRSIACLAVTISSCFILSIPFFGAWRVRSYVKNLQLNTEEVMNLVAKKIETQQLSSGEDLGAVLGGNFPLPARYIPSFTVEQLLESGHLPFNEYTGTEEYATGISTFFFGEILKNLNGFIIKTFLWMLVFMVVPFFIFYQDISKENRQALDRRMRMMEYK